METTTVVSAASTAGPNTSALAVAGAIMLTAAGIIIIPRLMRKYSYKICSSRHCCSNFFSFIKFAFCCLSLVFSYKH